MQQSHTFCITYTISDPFPLTEYMLCYFASYGTWPLKTVKSGLRNAQISLGFLDPSGPVLTPTLEESSGWHCLGTIRGSAAQIRLPITKRTLAAPTNLDRVVLWAITTHILSGIQYTLAAPTSLDRVVLWAITTHILSGIQRTLTLAAPTSLDRVVLWAIACMAFFGFRGAPASNRRILLPHNLAWGGRQSHSDTEAQTSWWKPQNLISASVSPPHLHQAQAQTSWWAPQNLTSASVSPPHLQQAQTS